MNVRKSVFASAVLAAAMPVWAHCGSCGVDDKHAPEQHGQAQAEVGKPAPEFTLKSVDGTEHKLSEYKGKIVVLEWTNHQCPVVNRCHDAKTVEKTIAKFEGKPVVWLAIDSSHFCEKEIKNITEWNAKHEIGYPVLLDAKGEVGHQYGAKTTPHMFVIDVNGVLAYAGAIDNTPETDDDAGVRNYVEEAVTALLEGSTVATAKTKPYGCSVKYKG